MIEGFDASPFWQNAFLVGVFVVLGWCVWNGWRLGIVRALWSAVAMTAAAAAGVGAGLLVGGAAMAVAPTMSGMLALAAVGIAGVLVYVFASFIGGLLFKRTAQQPTATLRFGFGLGGAAIGVFFGLCTVWAALLFVRAMGGLCEGTLESKDGIYALPMPEPAARALVKLKNSVEAGSTGKVLEAVDIMPREFYELMDKFGVLVADPEAMRRFISYPEVKAVLADTNFLALVHDPEIQEIARSQDGAALVGHPKLLAAVKDPGLLAKLQKIDIHKALDYALNAPQPAATPGATPIP